MNKRSLLIAAMVCLGAGFASAQSSYRTVPVDPSASDASKQAHISSGQATSPGLSEMDASLKMDNARQHFSLPEVEGFTYTGDPDVDKANYLQAKQAWIAAHPAEYQNLQNSNVVAKGRFKPENATPVQAQPTAAPQ